MIKLGPRERTANGHFINAYLEKDGLKSSLIEVFVGYKTGKTRVESVQFGVEINDLRTAIDLIREDS